MPQIQRLGAGEALPSAGLHLVGVDAGLGLEQRRNLGLVLVGETHAGGADGETDSVALTKILQAGAIHELSLGALNDADQCVDQALFHRLRSLMRMFPVENGPSRECSL